jgi:hypothetical protein
VVPAVSRHLSRTVAGSSRIAISILRPPAAGRGARLASRPAWRREVAAGLGALLLQAAGSDRGGDRGRKAYLGDALVRESLGSGNEAARDHARQEAEKLLQAELTLNPTSASAVTSLCYLHATGRDLRKVHEVLNGFARENPSVATWEFIAGLYDRMKLGEDAARWRARARLGPGK